MISQSTRNKCQSRNRPLIVPKNIDGQNIDVTYTKAADGNLYPRFEKYAHPDYPNPIEIKKPLTGVFSDDLKIIRQETGVRLPKGYTWHHLEDGKSVLMVPSKIHSVGLGGFSHIGGGTGLRAGVLGG